MRRLATVYIRLFHPDYTVGIGIAPIQERRLPFFADFTAGEELHLAPKLFYFFRLVHSLSYYIQLRLSCQAKQRIIRRLSKGKLRRTYCLYPLRFPPRKRNCAVPKSS